MKKVIFLVPILTTIVTLVFQQHQLSVAMSRLAEMHQMGDSELHLMPEGNNKVVFNYKRTVDPQSYRPSLPIRPQIMNFLPLTRDNGKKMMPLDEDIQKIRSSYLSSVAYNKTVNMTQAIQLAHLFTTQLGKAVLTYFWRLSASGLNFYHLSPRSYRLWLAIKILAGRDIKQYARSMVQDMELFREFYRQAWQLKKTEIEGISQPTPLDLVKSYHSDLFKENKPQTNKKKEQKNSKISFATSKLKKTKKPLTIKKEHALTPATGGPTALKKTDGKQIPKILLPKSSPLSKNTASNPPSTNSTTPLNSVSSLLASHK